MRLIILLAFLCSCTVGPTVTSTEETKGYYKVPVNTVYPKNLAPIMDQLGGLYLFKRITVAVDQGVLGFDSTQLLLIKKACSYINEAVQEDIISYTSKSPDVSIVPDDFACCLGIAEVVFKKEEDKLTGLVTIKTLQSNDQFYSTVIHEFGHVLGLEHSNATGSVMNAYMEDPSISVFSEAEIKTLQYLRRFKNR